jgi:SRSO17 transposase
MAQAARRSAWPSSEVQQAENQARVWADGLVVLHERIGGRFGRVEPRRRGLAYLRGLLSQVERNNSWWLAEQAGEQTPDGMQRLLNGSGWDTDGVRDDLRDYVVEYLGDPHAVLVLDETGVVQEGRPLGRGPAPGHRDGRQAGELPGRGLPGLCGPRWGGAGRPGPIPAYLPKSWTDDRARCRAAGVPEEVGFQTKPQLGQAMLERALAAGVPFGWVTGDAVSGGDRRLRVWLAEHAIRHVMAVKCTEPRLTMTDRGPGQVAAQNLIAEVEPEQWLRSNAGDGSKGRRFYDWTRVPLWRWGWPANVGFWLLARRSLSDPGELAFSVCFAPADTSLATLVQVAGCRWRVEEAFEQAKGEVGLDHDQVRQYLAWYRHITLAMTALAFLAVTRAQFTDPTTGVGGRWW